MARRTFFSFHYMPDVSRANVVKNCWVTKEREDAGFFDSSAFETAQKKNDEYLKAFLNNEMDGASVVCVLVGTDTASRRWVRYEIQRGILETKGLLAIRIHTIRNFQQQTSTAGTNPFDVIGVHVEGNAMRLIERQSTNDQWHYSSDFSQVLPKWKRTPNLPGNGSYPLSYYFSIFDWNTVAHNQIGSWIETAASQVGR